MPSVSIGVNTGSETSEHIEGGATFGGKGRNNPRTLVVIVESQFRNFKITPV
jgi:hypothetical protein